MALGHKAFSPAELIFSQLCPAGPPDSGSATWHLFLPAPLTQATQNKPLFTGEETEAPGGEGPAQVTWPVLVELDSNSCLSNQTPPPLRCTISLHTGLSGPACFLVCNTLLWPPLSFQPAEVGHENISFLILLRRVRRLREGT